MDFSIYLHAFLVGGAICMLGQLILDLTTLTQGHVLSSFVVAGGILGGLGIYDKLVKFALWPMSVIAISPLLAKPSCIAHPIPQLRSCV